MAEAPPDPASARPLPTPTDVSRPFWDGTREERLRLQRCAACGTLRHYPRPLCSRCWSPAVDWVDETASLQS